MNSDKPKAFGPRRFARGRAAASLESFSGICVD